MHLKALISHFKIEKRRGEQYYGSHILLKNEISEQDLADLKKMYFNFWRN